MKQTISLLFLVLIVSACTNQSEKNAETTSTFNIDSVRAQIELNKDNFIKSFATGDSALFVSLFTKDGCLMPDGAPKMCGPAALYAFLKGGIEMGIGGMKLDIIEVTGGPELVSEEGVYQLMDKEGKSVESGKFLVTWKQEDGVWKRYRDTWNAETPAPAAH
jgi:ketosteroid isomerase-like protein